MTKSPSVVLMTATSFVFFEDFVVSVLVGVVFGSALAVSVLFGSPLGGGCELCSFEDRLHAVNIRAIKKPPRKIFSFIAAEICHEAKAKSMMPLRRGWFQMVVNRSADGLSACLVASN